MVSKNISPHFEQKIQPEPISHFVSAMEKYSCDVTIRLGTVSYNAKSIIGVLASCFSCVDSFEVVCDGSDEALALEKAEEIFLTNYTIKNTDSVF